MPAKEIGGFNTSLQQVDERYAWINDMIRSRQELLLKYVRLLKLDPMAGVDEMEQYGSDIDTFADGQHPTLEQITSFCDHLIDYISHGHFDLYPKIVELIENASGRSLSIAQRVMPKIERTTEFLMRFNDKYSENLTPEKLETLRDDLAAVGDYLEQRFKSEDRLIIGLRLVHTIVATPTNPPSVQ